MTKLRISNVFFSNDTFPHVRPKLRMLNLYKWSVFYFAKWHASVIEHSCLSIRRRQCCRLLLGCSCIQYVGDVLSSSVVGCVSGQDNILTGI